MVVFRFSIDIWMFCVDVEVVVCIVFVLVWLVSSRMLLLCVLDCCSSLIVVLIV